MTYLVPSYDLRTYYIDWITCISKNEAPFSRILTVLFCFLNSSTFDIISFKFFFTLNLCTMVLIQKYYFKFILFSNNKLRIHSQSIHVSTQYIIYTYYFKKNVICICLKIMIENHDTVSKKYCFYFEYHHIDDVLLMIQTAYSYTTPSTQKPINFEMG